MNTYTKSALISSSLTLPLTLLSGTLVSWYLKANNPDNVDITGGLAYLQPILITSFTVFFVLTLMSLVSIYLSIKKGADRGATKLALCITVAVLVISGLTALLQTQVAQVEDTYRAKRVESFFGS